MGKSLIIVESPAKVKTIKKFLGPGYLVQASVGHIRDLPKSNIGVDEANDFAPEYEIIQGKEKVVQSCATRLPRWTPSSSPPTLTAKGKPSRGTSPNS